MYYLRAEQLALSLPKNAAMLGKTFSLPPDIIHNSCVRSLSSLSSVALASPSSLSSLPRSCLQNFLQRSCCYPGSRPHLLIHRSFKGRSAFPLPLNLRPVKDCHLFNLVDKEPLRSARLRIPFSSVTSTFCCCCVVLTTGKPPAGYISSFCPL